MRVETAAAHAPRAIVLERLKAQLVVLACGVSHRALLEVRVATAAARAPQAIALERLKAKLVVLAEERQLAEVAELRGDAVKAEWGQQVRPACPAPQRQSSNRKAHVQMLAACMCGHTPGEAKDSCVPHVLGPRRAHAWRRAHMAHRLLRCSMASAAAAHAQSCACAELTYMCMSADGCTQRPSGSS